MLGDDLSWFTGVRFSKFHDFSMTFDDFSNFYDFPWLFRKKIFFQVFQTLWEPWSLYSLYPKTQSLHSSLNVRKLLTIWYSQIHYPISILWSNRLVSQMRASLAACREPAGKLWQLYKVLYVFEHKTQYLLIQAPFTRIAVFWHIDKVPPMIS